MRSRGWACALVLALLTGCSAPAVSGPSVEEQVGSFLEQYMAAISARDAEAIRASIVSDGRFAWVEDGEVRYREVEDLLASLAQFPAESRISTVLSDLVVVEVGESAAHAWARFQTTVGDGPGGFSFGGAISFVVERRDGGWRLVGGHTSSPRAG